MPPGRAHDLFAPRASLCAQRALGVGQIRMIFGKGRTLAVNVIIIATIIATNIITISIIIIIIIIIFTFIIIASVDLQPTESSFCPGRRFLEILIQEHRSHTGRGGLWLYIYIYITIIYSYIYIYIYIYTYVGIFMRPKRPQIRGPNRSRVYVYVCIYIYIYICKRGFSNEACFQFAHEQLNLMYYNCTRETNKLLNPPSLNPPL